MNYKGKKDYHMEGILRVLDCRRKHLSPKHRAILATDIHRHLESKWLGGMDYNMWYTCHTAVDMGVLNERFEPVRDCNPVREGATQSSNILGRHGFEGLVAYCRSKNISRSIGEKL